MFRSNLCVLFLSFVTVLSGLSGCIADHDTRDDVIGETSIQEPECDVGTPWPEGELARSLKRVSRVPVMQEGGPTGDFAHYAFIGNLGSPIYNPVATGSTIGLSSSFQPSCAYSSNAPDAVYTWTAPSSGSYVFTTGTSNFDTILEVRPFNNTSATLGCNDDWGTTLNSAVTVSLTAGQTVYVIVDGYSTAQGYYGLNIARSSYPPGWTTWLDRDYPSGVGDYETLQDFVNAGQTCANPTAVDCQTLSGVPWYSAGEAYTCNTAVGGYCKNAEQPDGSCLDYRVRFFCP